MNKYAFSTCIAAMAVFVGLAVPASAASARKYALCVGINDYSPSYGARSLYGCVNDAKVFRENLVDLGGWPTANTKLLVNSGATRKAIRSAMASFAKKAVSGDTFVYQHSSHGGYTEGKDVYLCAYDANYTDAELAADLAAFPAGVKVVVVVDACYSGGLFKKRSRTAVKGEPSDDGFNLAQRVSAIMDAGAGGTAAKGGARPAKKLSSSEIGWVTAAEYYETSIDFGYYDTDRWLTDPTCESGLVLGGTFLSSFTWSWWNGSADVSAYGDGDGSFDAYEGWSEAYDFCVALDDFWGESGSSFTPQVFNSAVLRRVELGRVGRLDWSRLAPANDDFANATAIRGTQGSAKGTNEMATREDGEPWHNGGYETGSAWWKWTAPSDCTIAFNTDGSAIDTVMAVYSGDSVGSLAMICSNDDYSGSVKYSSRCAFKATKGQTYRIAVAGYSKTGSITLKWAPAKALSVTTTKFKALVERDGEWWGEYLEASGGGNSYSWRLADESSCPEDADFYSDGWISAYFSDEDFGTTLKLGVIVSDDIGNETAATITITPAEDPDKRPEIVAFSPEEDFLTMLPWQTQRFSVSATDPNGDTLYRYWYLYELVYDAENDWYDWNELYDVDLYEKNDGGVLFRPSDYGLPDGLYAVEAKVRDGKRSAWQDWFIEVTSAAPTPEPSPAPAAWESQYTIRFDPAGGSGTMPEKAVALDGTALLPANAFTRAGHSLVGWATRPGGPVRYLDGALVGGLTTVPGDAVTLYAVWADASTTVFADASGAVHGGAVRSFTSLQDAIDAAPAGGLVLAFPGLYKPIEADDKAIEIRALFSPGGDDACVIDGDWDYCCALLGDDTLLTGFVLSRGGDYCGGCAYGGTLEDCILEDGWAFYGAGAYGSVLRRCTVSFCDAEEDGGGLYECEAGDTVVEYCSSYDDNGFGGGAYHSTLSGCTVHGCMAGKGAGVAGCAVRNSIVWENRLWAVDSKGKYKLGNYANVTNGKKTLYKTSFAYSDTSPKPAGTGNIAQNPLFTDVELGDYRLTRSSPVKNKGKAAYASGALDREGLPRLVGAPDMGAHEILDATPVPADYDGDGKADAAYFVPATATWALFMSRDGLCVEQFGDAPSQPVPGDFDGDGRADLATYCATAKTPAVRYFTWLGVEGSPIALGSKGAQALVCNLDGDGRADIAVFQGNAKTPTFKAVRSADNYAADAETAISRTWGAKGSTPVVGDFDGDGVSDFGFYTSAAAKPKFSVLLSGENWSAKRPLAITVGAKGSTPCCGDFDGDYMTDFAAYCGSAATPVLWRVLSTSKWMELRSLPLGFKGSRPVVADWNGDGLDDPAVECQGAWNYVSPFWSVLTIL